MITENDFFKMKKQIRVLMMYSSLLSIILIVMLLFSFKKE